jgi:tRNA G18 (ribose-2'-O)-methylase SpoU
VALISVADPGDPRIADYRNLPDPVLLEQRRVFVAEGRLVVERLLTRSALVTRSVMVTTAAAAALAEVFEPRERLPIYVVPQAVMNGVTGFNVHRGCLAIGERPAAGDWRTAIAHAKRLVILERVANADNVGAIFRDVAAFAADAVVIGPDCADPLYRKAIRTSMGAALTVPFAHATRLGSPGWPEALPLLHADGFVVLGLTPRADARPLRDVASRFAGARVAIVAGHEGEGLTPDAMAACDVLARIPMAETIDSLNVATAVAIALYELQ